MKKLKKLSAIVAAAAIMGFTAPAAFATEKEQKFDIPKYEQYLKDAEVKTSYLTLTPDYQPVPINDPSEAQGGPVITITKYGMDRNNDGKIDLVYTETKIPELEFTNPFTGQLMKKPGYTVAQLAADNTYDGYPEKEWIDAVDELGNEGFDGIYDEEHVTPTMDDLME